MIPTTRAEEGPIHHTATFSYPLKRRTLIRRVVRASLCAVCGVSSYIDRYVTYCDPDDTR